MISGPKGSNVEVVSGGCILTERKILRIQKDWQDGETGSILKDILANLVQVADFRVRLRLRDPAKYHFFTSFGGKVPSIRQGGKTRHSFGLGPREEPLGTEDKMSLMAL